MILTRSISRCHGLARRASRAVLFVAVFVLAACAPSDTTPGPAATQSTAAGELTLTIAASDTQLTTTDRLTLTLTAEYPTTANYAHDPAFLDAVESAGWTIVATHADPPRLIQAGRLARTSTAILEPFLPGDYEIPSLTATFAGETATLDPIPVSVNGLLPEDDLLAESPELAELRKPPPIIEDNSTALPVVIAIVVTFTAVVLIIRRNATTPTDASPADQLRDAVRTVRRIADASAIDCDDLTALHAAVQTAEHHTSATDPALTADLEHARFGPNPPSAQRAGELAERSASFVRTAQDMFLVEQRRGGAHG
ncbi:MAG: hypothetical protein AAF297_01735 [Planctomycetota bacterium]